MTEVNVLHLPNHQFSGLKFRIAREQAHLSGAELAERTATSASFITACEKGRKRPSLEVEQILAHELGVNRMFFYGPNDDTWELERCHFRHRQIATERVKGQFRAQLYVFTEILRVLRKFVKFPTLNLPRYALKTETPIEAIAANLRMQWGIGTGTPIDRICRLVENTGVVVGFHTMECEAIDACSHGGEIPVILATKSGRGVSRLHYDIAHELGELIFTETASSSAVYERLINKFVGALFMPAEGFVPHFRSSLLTFSHLWELKKTWRVSASAILQRALGLGLLVEPEFRLWKRKMNARGFARTEPQEPEFADPESLKRALTVAAQAGVSTEDIAAEIGVSVGIVENVLGANMARLDHPSKPRLELFG